MLLTNSSSSTDVSPLLARKRVVEFEPLLRYAGRNLYEKVEKQHIEILRVSQIFDLVQ